MKRGHRESTIKQDKNNKQNAGIFHGIYFGQRSARSKLSGGSQLLANLRFS